MWISQGPAPLRWLGNEVAGGSAEQTGSALYVPNGFAHVRRRRLRQVQQCRVGVVRRRHGVHGQGNPPGRTGRLRLLDHLQPGHRRLLPPPAQSRRPPAAGSGYNFTSSLATNVAVVTGKVGRAVRQDQALRAGRDHLHVGDADDHRDDCGPDRDVDGGSSDDPGRHATFIAPDQGPGLDDQRGLGVLVAAVDGVLRRVRAGRAAGVRRGRRGGHPRRRDALHDGRASGSAWPGRSSARAYWTFTSSISNTSVLFGGIGP